MRILWTSLALALLAVPASAQIDNPGATQADITAALPPICAAVPPKDSLTGDIGIQPQCTPRVDRTAIVDVQTGNTTLAANCQFSFAFARAFTSSQPFVYAAVVDGTNAQMPCKIQSRSTTTVSGVCNAAQNTVLNLSIVTTGLTLLPFGTTCTAGTPVMVVGKEPTQ